MNQNKLVKNTKKNCTLFRSVKRKASRMRKRLQRTLCKIFKTRKKQPVLRQSLRRCLPYKIITKQQIICDVTRVGRLVAGNLPD